MTSEAQTAIDWVQELYKNTGVNMADFARLCGVSKTAVRSWLNAYQCPKKESLVKIGNAFGLEPLDSVIHAVEENARKVLNTAVKGSRKKETVREPKSYWAHDGKDREFCKEKHCEWRNRNGICNLPVCMKEVPHANTRESEKD